MATETTSRAYAAREDKAARFAAYFHAHGVTGEMVSRMGLKAPEWAKLAAAITSESGRKLLPPHSQETVDCIVRNLGYYEQAQAQAEAEQGAVAFDFRSI